MMRKKYLIILVLAVLLLTVFSCGKKEEGVPSKEKVTLESKLVLEGYKGFNIISYGDKYYGLDQNEETFYITKVEKKEYKKCFIGKSIEEVKGLIDIDLGSPAVVTVTYKGKKETATVSVSAATSGPMFGGIRAFDDSNDPKSFWEAGGFPQWVQIAYQENKKIVKYSLLHGKLGGTRMPKAWQFQASKDGVNWIDLDKRKNQTDWKPNEGRIYNVEKPSSYKYYRLLFTEGNEPILRIYEIKFIYG